MDRERGERVSVESQMRDARRESAELQARYDAHSAELNARYVMLRDRFARFIFCFFVSFATIFGCKFINLEIKMLGNCGTFWNA